MSIILPCDLATWPSVTSYMEVLASGLDSVQDVIVTLLQIHDLCNVALLKTDNARHHDESMFDTLFDVIENQFSPVDRIRFLKKTLPCIVKYAGALPDLRPDKFEYFLASRPASMRLDRRFVASLAANAFLSTLPVKSKELWPFNMPDLSFHTLFPSLNKDFISALRFKGFLEYFDLLEEEQPCGRISYNLKIRSPKETISKEVPRKTLSPVFIVEEDIRPLDLTTNLDSLIIKDLSSLTDMNLQHVELIPLLLVVEPILQENEWIEIKGLMSRSSNEIKNGEIMHQNDEACVCIIERTNPLDQTNIFAAQTCCWSILENCVQAELDAESSNQRSKLSTMPSFSDEENNSVVSSFSDHRPKRQCFEDRLKMALQRGDTPDEDDSNMDGRQVCSVSEQSFDMMQKRRCINDPEDIFARSNQISNEDPDDASSFANDSAYSFESLIVPYEMEGEIEDLQLSLVKPLHTDEQYQLRSLAITDELKRMSLSDAYVDRCLHLDKTTQNVKKDAQRRYQSDLGRAFHSQKYRRQKSNNLNSKEEESNSKLPIWIVTQSEEVDSKRFLVEWLAASVQDVPLVVYQASNGSICTDVVAAICSWIEEQSWTTQELQNALIHGSSSF